MDHDVSEIDHDQASEELDDISSAHSQGSQGRGRPRVIESWTRVVTLSQYDPEDRHVYPLNTDLLVALNLPTHLMDNEDAAWRSYFLPKDFVKANFGITMEAHQLNEEMLMEKG